MMMALAIGLAMATSASAQRLPSWDNPPGSAFQDRGVIEDQGRDPVLTPRGYRPADTLYGRRVFLHRRVIRRY